MFRGIFAPQSLRVVEICCVFHALQAPQSSHRCRRLHRQTCILFYEPLQFLPEMLPKTAYYSKKPRSRSKYGNRKTKVDGITFDSKWESQRYLYLKSLERAGRVKNLQLQPRFIITVNGQKICTYVADFEYDLESLDGTWEHVIEDAKGVETPEFKLKKKLMKAVHNIEIYLSKKSG